MALRALERVEATSPVLRPGSPAQFRIGEWWAMRAGAPTDMVARLPADERPETTRQARTVSARTSATAVRLAKLGDRSAVRARAFYLDRRGTPLTIKIATGPPAELARVRREVAARATLGSGLRTPEVVDAGTVEGVAYLVEEIVFGSHPSDADHKQALAMRLADDLISFHRGRGVVDGSLEFHPSTRTRLDRLITVPWLQELAATGEIDLVALAGPVASICADGRPVPIGLGHGDLGFSNVIVTEGADPVIVDWEHAGTMPAATDLAKLAVMAPRPMIVADHILESATPDDIGDRDGRMPLRGQLAAIIVRELSWWESRLARATAAGRRDPFARGVRRRLRLLAHLSSS